MEPDVSMFFAGLIVGGIWGVLLVLAAQWIGRAARRARHRRRMRKLAGPAPRTPLPQLWATGAGSPVAGASGAARRDPGTLDEFMDGPRHRPSYNPDPGPRDW